MSEQVKAALVIGVSLIAATVGCGGSSPTSPTGTTASGIPKANLVVTESRWVRQIYNYYAVEGVVKNQGPGCATDIRWRVEYFGTSGTTANVLLLEGSRNNLQNVNTLRPNVSAQFDSHNKADTFKDRVTHFDVRFSWSDVACP